MHLGIDFGTTRSVVATCDRGNYPIVSFVDENGDATDWYPSVVAERDGEFRYGFDALEAASDPSWTILRSFKRELPESSSLDTSFEVGSSHVAIGELLTGFLSTLRQDLLTRSNISEQLPQDAPIPALVATPAHALSAQRFLTMEGFQRAGFDVIAMLNEPSAAGFEYAHRFRNTFSSRREHVVVYDLGGGTFDASLVRMRERHHDVVTTAGLGRLGGDDFDAVLMALVLDQAGLKRSVLTSHQLGLLIDQCRLAKESLHPNSRRILIDLEPCLGEDVPVGEIAVATSTFYEHCSPLIDHTLNVMRPVVSGRSGGSEESDTSDLSDIAGIYVVGGASALPIVARALRQKFGRRVHRSPYPSAATAIGLSIAGDAEAGFQLTDRFSRTFGVFREASEGAHVSFDPILTKETRIPSDDHRRIVSSRTYRAAHNVGHFRYVECDSLNDDGSPNGDVTPYADVLFAFDPSLQSHEGDLRSVPILRTPSQGPLVQELYAVDARGLVEVTIKNLETGHEIVHRAGD